MSLEHILLSRNPSQRVRPFSRGYDPDQKREDYDPPLKSRIMILIKNLLQFLENSSSSSASLLLTDYSQIDYSQVDRLGFRLKSSTLECKIAHTDYENARSGCNLTLEPFLALERWTMLQRRTLQGFRVWGSGSMVQGTCFRVHGSARSPANAP